MDKTATHDVEAKKTQSGYDTAMKMIESATLSEVEEYKGKVEKSDKYTPEKKAELTAAINKRIEELKLTEATK